MLGSWDCPVPIRVKDPWVSNRVMNGGYLLCGGLGKALHLNVCCQELSFVSPTGLRNGQQWSEQGYSQATDKDDRNKKTRTVCSWGLAAHMETKRKDRMTLRSRSQCFAEREQKMQGRYHSSCRRENTSEHLFDITVWEAKYTLPNHSYNAFAARKNATLHIH